jgi:hypothetical protein
MVVVTTDGERHGFDLEVDHEEHALKLESYRQPPATYELTYRVADPTHIALHGAWAGTQIVVGLRAHVPARSELLDREFHFVDDGGYWQ